MAARPSIDVLIPEDRIRARVAEMGRQITRDQAGRPLTAVGVLGGSFVFLADLARQIEAPLRIEFLGIRSYQGPSSSGRVQLTLDLGRELRGEDVLLVEDVLDTGLTLRFLLDHVTAHAPATLKVCVLLEKRGRARARVPVDYRGFLVGEEFVVGYGLDRDGLHRNLPYLGVVRSERA